jgi:small subunit ribosomal protein S14
MAKKSMIAREHKRIKMVAKYAEKRAALKAIMSDESASSEERYEASIKFQKSKPALTPPPVLDF